LCREEELVRLAESRPQPYNITTSLQQLHSLRHHHIKIYPETILMTYMFCSVGKTSLSYRLALIFGFFMLAVLDWSLR
jgi:hypothetical protein